MDSAGQVTSLSKVASIILVGETLSQSCVSADLDLRTHQHRLMHFGIITNSLMSSEKNLQFETVTQVFRTPELFHCAIQATFLWWLNWELYQASSLINCGF